MALEVSSEKDTFWPFALALVAAWLAVAFAMQWLGAFEKAVPVVVRKVLGCAALPCACVGAFVSMNWQRRGATAPAALLMFVTLTVFWWFGMQLFRGGGPPNGP